MDYSEQVLEEILYELSGSSTQKEAEKTKKVSPFSWAYAIQKKEFSREKIALNSAMVELDFEKELSTLNLWRKRYSDDENLLAKKLTKRLDTLISNVQKKIKKKKEFHKLIATMHYARKKNDIKKVIDCCLKIYENIGENVCSDIYQTLKNDQKFSYPQYIKGGKPRILAELSQYVASYLSYLYETNAENAAQYNENKIEWKSHAKDWENEVLKQRLRAEYAIAKSVHRDTKSIEPFLQNSFENDGLYGPNSPFIQNHLQALKEQETKVPQKPINNGYLFSPQVMKEMERH